MKSYGWILTIKGQMRGKRFARYSYGQNTSNIREAFVWSSRSDARAAKCSDEVVCKVELFKNAKAKRLIERK